MEILFEICLFRFEFGLENSNGFSSALFYCSFFSIGRWSLLHSKENAARSLGYRKQVPDLLFCNGFDCPPYAAGNTGNEYSSITYHAV